jgi:hypothetical protein
VSNLSSLFLNLLLSLSLFTGAIAHASSGLCVRALRVRELNGKVFDLKTKSDFKAKQLEDSLIDYLQTAPVLRERPDFKISSGFGKKVYELLGGGLILFQPLDENSQFSQYQINGEVGYFEASRLLNINGVPVTVARKINGREGSAQFFFAPEELDRATPAQPSFPIRLLDWIVNNGDRHEGNILHHQSGQEIAIDHGWAFERNGGFPYFIEHGDHRTLDPFQENFIQETIKIVRGWDLETLLQFKKMLQLRTSQTVVDETFDRMIALLLVAKSAKTTDTFATIQGPQTRLHQSYNSVRIESRKFRHRDRVDLDVSRFFSSSSLQNAQILLKGYSKMGAQIRVHLERIDGPTVAVFRFPGNDRQEIGEFYFNLPRLPRGTKNLSLEFLEHREMQYTKLASIEQIGLAGNKEVSSVNQEVGDVRVGEILTLADEKYKIIKELGEGMVGRAYQVQSLKSNLSLVLKIATSSNSHMDLLENEPLRLSIYRGAGFAEFPKIILIGKNFILKDFAPGMNGDDWLKSFDPQNPDHLYAMEKLVDLMFTAARRGVLISLRNPRNLVWNGSQWIVFDPSHRTRVSENPAELLRTMAKHLRENWVSCKPLLQLLNDEDWMLRWLFLKR